MSAALPHDYLDRILHNLQSLEAGERSEALDKAATELLHFLAFESHHLVGNDLAKQVLALVHKSSRH